MLRTIHFYIRKYRLLDEDKPVLIGLSGGADSVALAAVLVRLGYECVAIHCNFHLRGEESDRDENFAKGFAHTLGIPFYKTDFDTTRYARENHLSIEMAARELRYEWFEEMRSRLNAQAIAVAHHRDDSVETVLMNMVRGTGIRGLSGITPKNGYIVRPLLAVVRNEILEWLKEQQLSYVTDSTNLSDEYTRNFIRLRVLPLLEEITPAVHSTIARTAEHLSAVETIYLHVIDEAREKIWKAEGHLSISALLEYPAPEAILYELLKPYGFTRHVATDVFSTLSGESGRIFYSPTHRLVKDREFLIVTIIPKEEKTTYILPAEEGHWMEPVELSCRKIVFNTEFQLEKNPSVAYFDYDKLSFPLEVRRWKAGDWFVPFGMRGRKKLSDYFSDHKFSRVRKEQVWLLCSGEDVIWIIGERPDNRYRVNNDTKQVLIVNFSG